MQVYITYMLNEMSHVMWVIVHHFERLESSMKICLWHSCQFHNQFCV